MTQFILTSMTQFLSPNTIPTTITSSAMGDIDCSTSLAALHPDVVRTHILSRLDGPALVAASCSSSNLQFLSADNDLWRSISESAWPSIANPLVSRVISTLPARHRSFFSDAYPMLDHTVSPSSSVKTSTSSLISAVDIYYKKELILSRVQEMETVSGWFMSSPFRVDLLEEKESVPTPIPNAASEKSNGDLDRWLSHVEENLTLSWILINPSTKRAANMSSRRPVSVNRHWLTGEVQARYVTVVSGGGAGGTNREAVCVVAEVTCWPTEGKEGAVEVREVNLRVEDMEGKSMLGTESLKVIVAAMSVGKRQKCMGIEEGKSRYEEYEVMKIKCRERKQRKERLLDLFCISVGVTTFVAFWSFVLFR